MTRTFNIRAVYQVVLVLLSLKRTVCLFFNKTSYVEVKPFNISQGFQLTFRTCKGGTLFKQNGTNGGYIELFVVAGSMDISSNTFTPSNLTLKWKSSSQENMVKVGKELDQNKPYDVVYKSGVVNSTLSVGIGSTQQHSVLASSSILNFVGVGNIVLGYGFVGCINFGSSFDLANEIKSVNTADGCSLDSQQCIKKDCPPGFKGYYCEININDCGTAKCHHASVCKDGVNNYTCECGVAWYGRYCDQLKVTKLCDSKPCANGGVCAHISNYNNYTCTCQEPYSGRNCTEIVDPCDSNPCANNGTCKNLTSTYFECKCTTGFTGKTCKTNMDDCAKADCGQGMCIDGIANHICNCTGTGFVGSMCQNDVNECKEQTPCHNGTCTNFDGGYKCSCSVGYTGKNCERNINDCASVPCVNGGNCTDLINGYSCHCPPEYSGQNCESKLHMCNINKTYAACANKPCKHGQCTSICSLYSASYNCSCDHGYHGVNCSVDIDECLNASFCENNSTCRNTPGDFYCECTDNYVGTFCNISRSICHPSPCQHGKCNNITASSYNCTCYEGWKGTNCTEDVNECVEKSDKCNTTQTALCNNTFGGYGCVCRSGFTGKYCADDFDECKMNKPKCLHAGICTNYHGGYKCHCSGYFGNHCEQKINYCRQSASNLCHNGTCVDGDGKHTCSCFEGWKGADCFNDIDECTLGYCKNNATCQNLLGNYTCTCVPGYTDRNCSTDIDECLSQPCQSNGKCIDKVNDFACNCSAGYEGKVCEIDINWCEPRRHNGLKPCLYGTCQDQLLNYTCKCFNGFAGVNCTIDLDECASMPCANGATCVQKSNDTAVEMYYGRDEIHPKNRSEGYLCKCQPGYNGTNCEFDIDECKLYKPCNNTGTLRCIDFINDYNCTCNLGFTGRNCSIDIDECASNPCLNNGTCLNLEARFKCVCRSNHTGPRCAVELDPCTLRTPCKNGATCTVKPDLNFTCSCAEGFDGETCTNKTTLAFSGTSSMTITLGETNVDIKFSFQTIFLDGALVSESPNWILALKSGVLEFMWLNKMLLTIDTALSDSRWHSVHLVINQDTISAEISNRTCLTQCTKTVPHPKSLASAFSAGRQLFVGKTLKGSDIPSFAGSIRDFSVNEKIYYPGVQGVSESDVVVDFQRQNVCTPNPCVNGECHDKWLFYTCKCNRNWTSTNCTNEVLWGTFGAISQLNNGYSPTSNQSYAKYSLSASNFKSISFSVKTRSLSSVMALLYFNNSHYLSIETNAGSLQLRYGKDIINRSSGVFPIADADEHYISINGSAISVDGIVHNVSLPLVTFQDVFVGGLSIGLNVLKDMASFRGCIRDIRVNNGQLLFFNQSSHLKSVQVNIANGCSSEDVCRKLSGTAQCLNNGNCSDLWNQYKCSCPWPHGGDNCEHYGCEWTNPCPSNATCMNVKDTAEFECLSEATFNGSQSSAMFSNSTLLLNTTSLAIQFRTWQNDTSLMVTSGNNATFFEIIINNGKVLVSYNLEGSLTGTIATETFVSDGKWHEVKVGSNVSHTVVTLYNINMPSSRATYLSRYSLVTNTSVLNSAFASLVSTYGLRFGLPLNNNNNQAYFIGCLGMVRIGDHLISFLPNLTVNTQPGFALAAQPFRNRQFKNVTTGCHGNPVCTSSLCGLGKCVELWNDFTCECPTGYHGSRCQYNPCTSSPCNHGNCTVTGLGYKCACAPGYVGTRCDESCTSGFCKNDGNCTTTKGKLECVCKPEWIGELCEKAKPRDDDDDDDDDNLPLIIGLCVAGVVLLIIIITIICCCTRQTSSTFGTYSPRTEEKAGTQVEMNTVMNVPPPEKLI